MSEAKAKEAKRIQQTLERWTGGMRPEFGERIELGQAHTFERGRVAQSWTMQDWMRNPDGSLFGGILSALFDQITALAAFSIIEEGEFIKTTQLQTDFHRPIMSGQTIEIEGVVANASRNAIHVDCSATLPDGRIAARGRAIYARVKIPADYKAPGQG